MRKVFFAIMAMAAITLVGCKDKKDEPEMNIDCSLPADAEAVDLGLPSGLKWANMNVGATKPEGYGVFFAWGETYQKHMYNWETYSLCTRATWSSMKKYTYPDGQTSALWYNENKFIGDNKTVLEPQDDAATANWGSDWRTPTKEEFDELCAQCTWTWAQKNGINGYEVRGSNGNSIFLPASGYHGGEPSPRSEGYYGHYWSSSLYLGNSSNACHLRFGEDGINQKNHARGFGHIVRPVCK